MCVEREIEKEPKVCVLSDCKQPESISCFCGVRQLDVHHLDRTLVYRRALQPFYFSLCRVPSRDASASIFTVFGMTNLSTLQSQGGHKSVYNLYIYCMLTHRVESDNTNWVCELTNVQV